MDSYEYLNLKQKNEERERYALFGNSFGERKMDNPYQNAGLSRERDFLMQGHQPLPVLQLDENIIPLVQKKQVKKRKPFHKARFLEDVRKLNKDARGLDAKQHAEKGYIAGASERIKAYIEDAKVKKTPPDIKKVLSTLNEYVVINATARENATQRGWHLPSILWWALKVWTNKGGSRSRIKREHELVAKLKKQLPDAISNHENEPQYARVVRELKYIYDRIIPDSGTIMGTFATNQDRITKKWADYDPRTSKQLDGIGKKVKTTADTDDSRLRFAQETDVIVDKKKQPLFAHRPGMEDICQGAAGNCYFLAALASIPGDMIRDMMLDHEDGTVTVRFFEKDEITEKRRPVYVTVDKVVKVNSALDCLWVQVMEKAYALFKQTRAKHRLVFLERKEKSVVTGEMVTAGPKYIERDTIDLGFVGNGGDASEVLGDLLGTYEEKIEIKTIKTKRKPSSLLMDALRCQNEKGKADSRIDRLKEELKDKERLLEDTARKVGVSTLMFYQLANSNGALRAYIDDFEDSKTRIQKEIKELREQHQLTDPQKIDDSNGVRVAQGEEGELSYKVIDEELIGMEKECEIAKKAIKKKFLAMGMTDKKTFNRNMQSALRSLVKFPKDLIDAALQAEKDLKTDSIENYQHLLKTLMNCADKKDEFFRFHACQNGSLTDYLNGDKELATEILSKFMTSILKTMMKNLNYMEDFSENTKIGEEDEIAIQYFERVEKMISRGEKVCCGSRVDLKGDGKSASGEAVDSGMVGRHAYTILKTQVTNDGVRMLKLRNPFGNFTADYKLNRKGELETYGNKEDTNGIFWVELSQFMKYVSTIYRSGTKEPKQE